MKLMSQSLCIAREANYHQGCREQFAASFRLAWSVGDPLLCWTAAGWAWARELTVFRRLQYLRMLGCEERWQQGRSCIGQGRLGIATATSHDVCCLSVAPGFYPQPVPLGGPSTIRYGYGSVFSLSLLCQSDSAEAAAKLTFEEISKLQERKAELKAAHRDYVSAHPELKTVLNDFMTAVLTEKPSTGSLRGWIQSCCRRGQAILRCFLTCVVVTGLLLLFLLPTPTSGDIIEFARQYFAVYNS